MLQSSPQSKLQSFRQFTNQSYLWKMIKRFWQFSNFYGEYTSLSPSDRRKFVNKVDSIDAISSDRHQK